MHKVGIDRDVELGDLHHDSGGVSAERNHLASVLSDLIRLSLDAQQLNHVNNNNNNNNFYYPYWDNKFAPLWAFDKCYGIHIVGIDILKSRHVSLPPLKAGSKTSAGWAVVPPIKCLDDSMPGFKSAFCA